jgi:hypothetical protein
MYAWSSLGWVIGAALLASRHIRSGDGLTGAGFVILTVAEALLWVSGRPDSPDYVDGFGGATLFYVAGLLLVGLGRTYPLLIRLLAAGTAVVWAIGAVGFLDGSGFSYNDPLALIGYPMISLFFLSVAIPLLRGTSATVASDPVLETIP